MIIYVGLLIKEVVWTHYLKVPAATFFMSMSMGYLIQKRCNNSKAGVLNSASSKLCGENTAC